MALGTAYGFFRSSYSSVTVSKTLRDIRQGMLNGMKLEPEPGIPKELRLDACASWYISNGMKAETFAFDVASKLYLRTTISGFCADQKLVAIAREWHGRGANYFIRAELPDASNERAADELGFVMNILYSGGLSIGRTEDDPNPVMDVYREKNGAYVSARIEPPGAG